MYDINGSSSDAISRDMNSLLYSSQLINKHPADGGEFAKIKQLISLDHHHHHPNNFNHQTNQEDDENNRTTTPTSFFSNLLTDEFPDPVTGSLNHEPDDRFFITNPHQQQEKEKDNNNHHKKKKKSDSHVREFLQYAAAPDMKQEQQQKESATAAVMSGSRRVPNLPPLNGYTNQSNIECGSSYGGARVSTTSNLVRQNSTPAGFLSSLTVENGFASVKKGGSLSTSNNHISFSLGPSSSSSSSRFLPQIAENENELRESSFSSMKRSRDGVLKMSHNGETGNNAPNLVHHMSLPKTSSEMANVENFLHFQQESTVVPWKTRAKRGFATHPRSIAERERRTRISERIKRLQELFPDIDKQTNTADMLDMAVEYIKNLQKELQNLNEARARCRCSTKQLQSGSNT